MDIINYEDIVNTRKVKLYDWKEAFKPPQNRPAAPKTSLPVTYSGTY